MDPAGPNYNNVDRRQHQIQNNHNYHNAISQDALHDSNAHRVYLHQNRQDQDQQQQQQQQHHQYHPLNRLTFGSSDKHSRLHDQEPLSSLNSAADDGNQTTNLVVKYVNLNLVRTMIAQHALEIIIVLVIVIYLVYYFSRISMRPKLVGNKNSAFVKLIKRSFSDSLRSRFSPLIYFWGTNPQTALFGYLQGRTSDHEVPRNKFKRQYLFVSDAQYLASNIDLSEHYESKTIRATTASTTTTKKTKSKTKFKTNRNKNKNKSTSQIDAPLHKRRTDQHRHRLVCQQLDAAQLFKYANCNSQPLANTTTNIISGSNDAKFTRLNENIRLVNQIEALAARVAQKETSKASGADDEANNNNSCQASSPEREMKILTRVASSDSSDSSAMGSSSDSGVFASDGNSSSSSSSSGSSLTIDMESSATSKAASLQDDRNCPESRQQPQRHRRELDEIEGRCSCVALYELDLQTFNHSSHELNNHHQHHDRCQPFGIKKQAAAAVFVTSFEQQQQQQQQRQEQIKREHLEFGQCALDWYQDSHKHYHTSKKVALISAGMTTGSDKKYVTDTVQTLDRLGYEVCVFIRRGVGGLKLSSTKFFSPSKWRDFEAAIVSIRKQRPGARLVAIGFSFGSIELCRYLSMSGSQSLVDSALLVSCPFDPEAGGRNMRKRALNRKIDAYLAKNLGKQLYKALTFDNNNNNAHINITDSGFSTSTDSDLEAHRVTNRNEEEHMSLDHHRHGHNYHDHHNQHDQRNELQKLHYNYNGSVIDFSSLPKIKSLVDFEDNFNRVIQNYPNSDAYAADSRLNEQLQNIKTPTLCLSSEDDFMAPVKLLPIKQIEENENLCMILTKRGGHMAFIDGILWPRKPYFAQRIIEKYMMLDTASTEETRTRMMMADGPSSSISSSSKRPTTTT